MSGDESPSLPSIEAFLDVDLVGVAAPFGVETRSLGVKDWWAIEVAFPMWTGNELRRNNGGGRAPGRLICW